MFKLVVLTALFAAAAAEPGLGYSYFGSPLGYSAGYYPAAYSGYYNAPLATTYAAPLAPAVSALPYSPVGHLIKKRSLVAGPLVTPTSYIASNSYVASGYPSYGYSSYPGYSGFPYYRSAPLASTYSYATPVVSSAVSPLHYPVAPVATHLIKKRSLVAPVVTPLATSYASGPIYTNAFAGQYATPYASTYAPFAGQYASPYFNGPLSYPSSFYIKK